MQGGFKTKTGCLKAAAAALLCCAAASFLPAPALAQTANPAPGTSGVNPASRDLQQMREGIERWQQQREVERMQQMRRQQKEHPKEEPEPERAPAFHFTLTAIEHNDSAILTDEEIARAVAPWIGTDVSMAQIEELLNAVNTLYRERGYVVCEARLRPQRIKGGRLFVTLVEGKTADVEVSGNTHTREGYILSAFDLKPGEVANFRDMQQDLLEFNMTNDVALRIDIRAGDKPETTDYAIEAAEPSNWTATVFADTTGTRTTGRPRAGASLTNRSLFGIRDSATLFGLASEGSKSVMASYSVPLTAKGTRLTASASWGDVEVVQGPSADADVEGSSEYYSLRLVHPFYVASDAKWSVFGEWSRQKSETEFWSITINDTEIDAYSAGLEAILLTDRSVFFATAMISSEHAEEKTFDQSYSQTLFKGNAFWRYRLLDELTVSLSGAWQFVAGGDELTSTQYFYLGHTSGVRGYDNDVLSAEEGAYINAQADWAFAGEKTSLFVFADAGRLTGTSSYTRRTLASVGAGVTLPLWKDASITASAGVPLVRDIGEGQHVNKARFDLAVVATW